ncbi:hypothetical protein KCP78_12655 [Salmonella enterica subsp. enterica]|nr:hypothetical protein KCP78_12655 [Salmonella enterica subsp. enterica]
MVRTSNVGKSTAALNKLLPGRRFRSLPVKRRPRATALSVTTYRRPYQAIYVDTPGLHMEEKARH